MRSSWYFTTTKTASSMRTVKFGDTLYQALKQERTAQLKNELKYGEYYTIHVLKKEVDEKGNDMQRIVPIQKCVESDLPRVRMVCIAENLIMSKKRTGNKIQRCSVLFLILGQYRSELVANRCKPPIFTPSKSLKNLILCGLKTRQSPPRSSRETYPQQPLSPPHTPFPETPPNPSPGWWAYRRHKPSSPLRNQ